MRQQSPARVWFREPSTSGSSASTRSHSSDLSGHSSRSSLTQFTNTTSHSYTTSVVEKDVQTTAYEVFNNTWDDHDEEDVDPRASVNTYASTIASEKEPPKASSLYPRMRHICYQPDAIPCTPAEFGELFPSAKRLLIQHDDTTPDGNLNLRVDTELTVSRGSKIKLTLFHFRMYDLTERQFSLRRYQRDSGREVCSSKRKYLKPITSPSPSSKRSSLTTAFSKLSLKSLAGRPRSKTSQDLEEDDSGEDIDLLAAQADVEATIPTDTMRIEFSNYAQVELQRGRRREARLYDFEYWGERYCWRRSMYHDESESVVSFEMINLATGGCVAHITADKISEKRNRQEATQGSWVPPTSMRILENQVSNDLGDVIVATGLMALTDDCIRRHWHEAHRH